jgi:hypothetical protein
MQVPAQLACLSAVAIAGFVAGIWILMKYRRSPAQRERLRREAVNRLGRMGDAMITDVSEDIIYYEYSVSGVEYTASQDISAIRDRVPTDPSVLIGPATIKYLIKNPFNSILLSEGWSGFRVPPSGFLKKGA